MAIFPIFSWQVTAVTNLIRNGSPVLDTVLNPRDRFSAWSHAVAALAALPATVLLWRRGRGNQGRQVNLLVYGLSMFFCYTASSLYHGVCGTPRLIAIFNRFDHIGIYLFIAGSFTGIGANMLHGRLKSFTLLLAWAWAAAGSIVQLVGAPLPPHLATGLYLAMGWGLALVYGELARTHSHEELRPLVLGGVLYSIGAAINLLGGPVLRAGFVGAHELFHLFVVAGSVSHFVFVLRVVLVASPAEVRQEAMTSGGWLLSSVSIAQSMPAGARC
jgi:hemolysin III